ncbi:hypothetical protein [Candidatus Planktophila versatilis]|uniref:hypothetical protein n=1 Tax=Candidatus Planktophila versatilis TaxID=1884905 RepID=UPI003CE89AFA
MTIGSDLIFTIGEPQDPYAIVIRQSAKVEGIKFFTPESSPQQIGLMSRPAGHKVKAHIHNPVVRSIPITQEVLIIRNGTCSVKIYDESLVFLKEIKLETGDTILLARGGHEILMNSDCEILEVKQGPYSVVDDKAHFNPEIK